MAKRRYLAAVKYDVGSDTFGAELLLVVTQQFDGLVVIEGTLVVPRSRVDARKGEVLVRLLTEQPQEGHLNDADRFVRHLPIQENDHVNNKRMWVDRVSTEPS